MKRLSVATGFAAALLATLGVVEAGRAKAVDWSPDQQGQYWCRFHPADCVSTLANGTTIPVDPNVNTYPGAWKPTNPMVLRVYCDKNRHVESGEDGNGFAAVSIVSNAGPGALVDLMWARNRGSEEYRPNSECSVTTGLQSVPARNQRSHAASGGSAEAFWNGGKSGDRLFRARADDNGRVKFRQYVEDCDTFYWQAVSRSNKHDCAATEAVPANNNYISEFTKDMWVIDNEVNWKQAYAGSYYNGVGDNALEQINWRIGGSDFITTNSHYDYVIAKFFEVEGTGGDIQLRIGGSAEDKFPSNYDQTGHHFSYDEHHNRKAKGMMPYLNVKWKVPFTIEFTIRQDRCCQSQSHFVLAHSPLPSDAFLSEDHFGRWDHKKFGHAINWYMYCSGVALQASDPTQDGVFDRKSPYDGSLMNSDLYEYMQWADYGDGVRMSDGYSDYVGTQSGRDFCSLEVDHRNMMYEDMRYKTTVPGDGSNVVGEIREPQGKEAFHDVMFHTAGTYLPASVGDYDDEWDFDDNFISIRPKTNMRYVPNFFKAGDELYFNIGPNTQVDGARSLYLTEAKTNMEVIDFANFMPTWPGTDYVEYSDYDGDEAPDVGIQMMGFTGENL